MGTSGAIRNLVPLVAKSSNYLTIPHATRTTLATTQSRLYLMPLWLPRPLTTTKIGAEVTTGAGSTTCRLGVYRADVATGVPTTLLAEAGSTIDGNSATVQEVDFAQTLTTGLWWLAIVPQGGTPTLRSTSAPAYAIYSTVAGGTAAISALIQSGVTSALPATFGATSAVGTHPLVWIKEA